ncbi:hypothetical protein ACFXGA_05805 [Actinosynnema sp. NPDC059335]|uniref:hypothetical protein n=1 Tax=Actinosynnema sp. NPDC059335 TaxID=3346804 RepID=UPI0036722751
MTHIPVNPHWTERSNNIDQIRSAKESVELTFWPYGYQMPDTGLALLALHWASVSDDRGGVQSIIRRVATLLDIDGVKGLRSACDEVIQQMEGRGNDAEEDEET